MSAFFMQFIQHLASNLEYALIGRREQYQVQQNLIRSKRSKRLQIWRYTTSPVVRSKQNLPMMTRTTARKKVNKAFNGSFVVRAI